jgi:hypothetical protein
MLPPLVVAVATVASFSVTSIFTSRILTGMDYQVLLRGRNCGWPMLDKDSIMTDLVPYVSQHFMSSGDYMLRCYQNASTTSQGGSGCPMFSRQRRA